MAEMIKELEPMISNEELQNLMQSFETFVKGQLLRNWRLWHSKGVSNHAKIHLESKWHYV